MAIPIIFILGVGPGIGSQVAKQFAENGYKVAAAARSLETQRVDDTRLDIRLDLTQPHTVLGAFRKVEEEFGDPPSVGVYNGAK